MSCCGRGVGVWGWGGAPDAAESDVLIPTFNLRADSAKRAYLMIECRPPSKSKLGSFPRGFAQFSRRPSYAIHLGSFMPERPKPPKKELPKRDREGNIVINIDI